MAINSYTWLSQGGSSCVSQTVVSKPTEPLSGLVTDAVSTYSGAGDARISNVNP